MKSTITGWGKCAPNNIMTNDDLAVFVDTSDEWIQQRTGIQERRFCHVNNSDMATVAGHHAVACAGLTPEDIDVVILATCTPDSIVPSAAAHVQKKLGAINAAVYDVNAACAGFVYALEQGKAFVESGLYKRALIIGSEHITWLLDWSDRNTAVLFGDSLGITSTDIRNQLIYTSIVNIFTVILYRPFLALTFNEMKAQTLGMSPKLSQAALLTLLSLSLSLIHI